jgi:cobalt-zinc-cadmium efflux system outer membrane protein
MQRTIASGSIAIAAFLTGCASPPRDQGFSDVAQAVRERTGLEVPWYQDGRADEAAMATIHQLLSTDLTIDTAIRVSLLCNNHLQASCQQLGISQAQLVQAGLLGNPSLSAEFQFFARGPDIQLSLVDSLLQLTTLPARRRYAQAELAEAKAQVAGAIIDLIADVRRSSYRCLAAGAVVALQRTMVMTGADAMELATRMHIAGNSSDLEFARKQIAYQQSRLALAAAEADQSDARERLTRLMGLWGDDAARWTMSGPLPGLAEQDGTGDGKGMESAAIRFSLDLAGQRERIRAIAERYGIARLDAWFGEVEAGASGQREAAGEWGAGPALTLSLPIFDQGQGVHLAANAALAMAAQRYAATAVDIRSLVRGERAAVRSLFARAHFITEKVLPLRSTVVRESMLHFNAMLIGPFQLLDAKRDEIESAGQYIDALMRYWLHRASLDQLLCGRLISADGYEAMPPSSPSKEDRHD